MQNFPWLLKCRILSVQGVSTLHPVLEAEASARQAWPEQRKLLGMGQQQNRRTWFGGRDTPSCLTLSSYFPCSYYIDGRVAKVTDFLKTRLLDTLSDQIRKIQKVSECKGSAGHSSQPGLGIDTLPGELLWARGHRGCWAQPKHSQPSFRAWAGTPGSTKPGPRVAGEVAFVGSGHRLQQSRDCASC